jgi:hypothetical protein
MSDFEAHRCPNGHLTYPGHTRCPDCGEEQTETVDLSERTATVVTWTTSTATPPGVREPNHLGIVEFDVREASSDASESRTESGDDWVRALVQFTTGFANPTVRRGTATDSSQSSDLEGLDRAGSLDGLETRLDGDRPRTVVVRIDHQWPASVGRVDVADVVRNERDHRRDQDFGRLARELTRVAGPVERRFQFHPRGVGPRQEPLVAVV